MSPQSASPAKWELLALLLAGFVALASRPAEACAGCSNPNLPSGASSREGLRAGEVSAALSLTGTTLNVVHSELCPEIGPICLERDEPGQLHDQRLWVAELRPSVELGLTERLGLQLELPLRLTRTTIVFRRLDGTPFTPDYENIHHRNETLSGLGDPLVAGRAAWRLGAWGLGARLGVTVPLGRTEEDPFALGRAGLPHQHLQFGTGTWMPLLGLHASRRLDRFTLTGSGEALLSLYQNRLGYRAGHRFHGGLSGETHLFTDRFRAAVGVDLLNEQPERWQGVIEQDGNLGRTDLLVGGRLSYAVSATTAVTLSAKFPVWQHFIHAGHSHGTGAEGAPVAEEPEQLTYPAIVGLSVQHTFADAP